MIPSIHDETIMLWPRPIWFDDVSLLEQTQGYSKLSDLQWPEKTFFHLHSQWHDPICHALPKDYDCYVISWHGEYTDFEWLKSQNLQAPVFILSDWNFYDKVLPDNFVCVRWIYWHRILEKIISWFGINYNKNIKYKVSAFCNRITQSKLWITTSLLENINSEDRLISLSDWLEEKNVHHWQLTDHPRLNELQNIFQKKWLGKKIEIDEFDRSLNFQKYTANPAHPAYQQSALHFTNESWHYSLMQEGDEKFVLPGPNFSEKTMKCLLGATAFIPVSQFDVYRTLSSLGMTFDYGLDLSFDQDPGNLSRAEKILDLIENLGRYSAIELYTMTKESSLHNQNLIVSGKFSENCEKINFDSKERLKRLLKYV